MNKAEEAYKLLLKEFNKRQYKAIKNPEGMDMGKFIDLKKKMDIIRDMPIPTK